MGDDMKDKLKSWLRALLVLPFLVLAGQGIYFRNVNQEIDSALAQEKYNEIVNFVEIMNHGVGAMIAQGAPVEAVEKSLASAVEFVDQMREVFAAVYRMDENGEPQLISTRYFGDTQTMFEPIQYARFLQQALSNRGRGEFSVSYNAAVGPMRTLRIYYRWLPDASNPDERYLVAAGVTQLAATAKVGDWVSIGQMASMGVTFVLQMALAVMLLRTGRLKKTRGG